jgi:hypothetical protein
LRLFLFDGNDEFAYVVHALLFVTLAPSLSCQFANFCHSSPNVFLKTDSLHLHERKHLICACKSRASFSGFE